MRGGRGPGVTVRPHPTDLPGQRTHSASLAPETACHAKYGSSATGRGCRMRSDQLPVPWKV